MLSRLLGAGQRTQAPRCFSALVRLPCTVSKIAGLVHLKACPPRRWSTRCRVSKTEKEAPERPRRQLRPRPRPPAQLAESGVSEKGSVGQQFFRLVVFISALLFCVVLCLLVFGLIPLAIVNAVVFLLKKTAEIFRW